MVLFFYRAALSPRCAKESCHFRDPKSEFDQLGAQPVSISMNSAERQAEFAQKNRFDYPLLAEVDDEVAHQFGVNRSLGFLVVRRASFVIG